MPKAYKVLRQKGVYLLPMMHCSPEVIYLPDNWHWQYSVNGSLFVFDSEYAANSFLETFSGTLFSRYREPYWIFEVETEQMVHCGMALGNSDLHISNVRHFWRHFSWSNGSYTDSALHTFATPLGTSATKSLRLVQALAIYDPDKRDVKPADLQSISWIEEKET